MGPIRVASTPVAGTPAVNDVAAQRTQGNMSGGAANIAGQSSLVSEKHKEQAQRLVGPRSSADSVLLDGLIRVASVNQKAKERGGRGDGRRNGRDRNPR